MFAFYQFHGRKCLTVSRKSASLNSLVTFFIQFYFILFYWRWFRGKFVSLYKFSKITPCDMHGKIFHKIRFTFGIWCCCWVDYWLILLFTAFICMPIVGGISSGFFVCLYVIVIGGFHVWAIFFWTIWKSLIRNRSDSKKSTLLLRMDSNMYRVFDWIFNKIYRQK